MPGTTRRAFAIAAVARLPSSASVATFALSVKRASTRSTTAAAVSGSPVFKSKGWYSALTPRFDARNSSRRSWAASWAMSAALFASSASAIRSSQLGGRPGPWEVAWYAVFCSRTASAASAATPAALLASRTWWLSASATPPQTSCWTWNTSGEWFDFRLLACAASDVPSSAVDWTTVTGIPVRSSFTAAFQVLASRSVTKLSVTMTFDTGSMATRQIWP